MNRNENRYRLMSRVTRWALAVLLLTTVHHGYGAYAYGTPWRLHVGFVSLGAAAGIVVSHRVVRRAHTRIATMLAFWTFVAISLFVPVLGIGLFEGGYNHVLKDALYFAGAPSTVLRQLFPAPAYEMPNDVFFELTGVTQLLPGLVTASLLGRLLRVTVGGASALDDDAQAVTPATPLASEVQRDVRRIEIGTVLPRRTLASISHGSVDVPDADRVVHVQFRRFAGCPVCNLHLHSFVRRHREIVSAGIQEVVVFHSTPADLRPFTVDLPLVIVADPSKQLYREFGVESSIRSLLDPRAWPAAVRGILRSARLIVRGQPVPPLVPHGGRLGLPADFLISPDGRVLARKYGVHADDQWSVDDVLSLTRTNEPSLSTRQVRSSRGVKVAVGPS